MAVNTRLRHAAATDPGRRRSNNEDRFYISGDAGVYAVIDGVGGHAAGERAAEAAVDVISERLSRRTSAPEQRIREAIALANNEIYRLSRSRQDWNGMACVLTVALIEDDVVTVGHVGDSRLYLLQPGKITKMTHDHSPVGEREDNGELSEDEAMRHARRNEIYRDVGASERSPDDPQFIEMLQFPMPPDGALLLCSDGLTDLVSSSTIRAGVERYAPDLDKAVRSLIEAANREGGKDNVTVILIAAPEYLPVSAEPAGEDRAPTRAHRRWLSPLIAGLGGFALSAVLFFFLYPLLSARFATGPRTYVADAAGIAAALRKSHSGDTIILLADIYKNPIELPEGVTLRSQQPGQATMLAPVVARNILTGSIEGIVVQGDEQQPLKIGIEIVNASVSVSNVKVTGAQTGIDVSGASKPTIASSQITNNLGPGIAVSGKSEPNVIANLIAANGAGKPGAVRPGVEVREPAKPLLHDNAIVDNAADPVWVIGKSYEARAYEENFFGGIPAKRAIRVGTMEEITAPASKPTARPTTRLSPKAPGRKRQP